MATTTDPIHRRRTAPWFALLALALLLAACGGDDGGDDDSSSGDDDATETSEMSDDEMDDDEMSDEEDIADEEAGDSIGTVEVDDEVYDLARVTGITSCDFEDPEGDFTVVAESADDEVFLGLYTYGEDPDSNEFTVAVGEVEYASESADDVEFSTVGRTVTGTVAVVPLFEEGTAQDVTFEVNCP